MNNDILAELWCEAGPDRLVWNPKDVDHHSIFGGVEREPDGRWYWVVVHKGTRQPLEGHGESKESALAYAEAELARLLTALRLTH